MQDHSVTLDGTLELDQFIFHLIARDEDTPRYFDQIPTDERSRDFFLDCFRQVLDRGTEYEFTDPQHSRTVSEFQELATVDSEAFVRLSKTLTNSFFSYHKGNTNDGLFIVARVKTEAGLPLLFLIKMDYERVMTFERETNTDGELVRAILKEVANPITQNVQALQKTAIVDVTDAMEWDVLAQDRATKTPRVGQYFEKFLAAHERDTSTHMTTRAMLAVRQFNVEHEFSSDECFEHYERARDYMNEQPVFEDQSFIERIVTLENPERREALSDSLNGFLREQKVAGKSFEMRPDKLKSSFKTHSIIADEGTKINFTGTMASKFIRIIEPGALDDATMRELRESNRERSLIIIETTSATVKT